MNATVRDVMSTGVIAVRGDTSFKEMAGMLGSSRVSGFPVIDEAGKVVGVVSETDMLIKEADRAGHPEVFAGLRRSRDHQKAGGVTAAELMTSPPVTIGPDEPVQHAAFLMYDRAVERLPVVDEAGHLIGIVSQVDVLSIFSRPDEEIRREATDGLIRQGFRVEPEHLRLTVQDGLVTLSGRPEAGQAGQDIIEAARQIGLIEGVVAVRDKVSPPDDRTRLHPSDNARGTQ
jgi:CBS domain-containing protein